MQALGESVAEKESLRQFQKISKDFFTTRTSEFVPHQRLPAEEPERSRIVRENLRIVSESCQICELLPMRVRAKSGLPLLTHDERAIVANCERQTLEPIE